MKFAKNILMKILLLGSGGREHALAWKIAQSPKLTKLFIAPGNAGTDSCGSNINMDVNDFEKIKTFVLNEKIDMVVVGPEDPLVNGISDYFQNDELLRNIALIGPDKTAAQLEGSKDFAKKFMVKYNIPTALYKTFNKENISEGNAFIDSLKPPYVLKADGLAAGKGVVILEDTDKAKAELKEMIEASKFGVASNKVVIEEFLSGIELSVFVMTDGKSYKILPNAKDYKRIGEGDTGPNTGGMGSISPVPFADKDFLDKIEERIIKPTINGLIGEDICYKGFIFFGIINVNGDPFVIEYNCRMGDPETESVIPRIKSDFVDLLEGVAYNNLSEKTIELDERFVASVMLVSKGYPGNYEKGKVITNTEKVNESIVFHAGTKKDIENNLLTNGGRVIAVTSFGSSMTEALELSYKNAEIISYEGKYYRNDLGKDLL
jgi:phosphoribosylamine--glycine ligase